MVLQHSLRNRGTKAIRTSVYNHNFLVLDGRAPGPGLVITLPFTIKTPRPPNQELAEVRGNQIVYLRELKDRETVAMPIEGFGEKAADYSIRIENGRAGAGMSIRGDRPLAKESLWSIRTVVAVEPFVAINLEPGGHFSWTATYDFYTTNGGN